MKFTDSFTKNRTAHWIEQVSREQTVKPMAPVERRHVIEILAGRGIEESADARRGQVRRHGRDHCTGLSPKQIRGGQHRAKRPALRWSVGTNRCNAVNGPKRS